MNKIFVSCGQYTAAEKSLGKGIVKMVKEVTGYEAFFAEDVSDLNGLDSNILGALRDSSGFITVLHPRGEIRRPDGSTHIRASVWIEQEIAIAAYIQHVEKKSLPVIAFVHNSVGREGIRDLLHLNPIPFTRENEVLSALHERLQSWKTLTNGGVRVEVQSVGRTNEQGHWIRNLSVNLINESSQRIDRFDCEIRLPAGILKHWSTQYSGEVPSDDRRYRCFRRNEQATGPIEPHMTKKVFGTSYCTQCAGKETGEILAFASAFVGESVVQAKLWIDGIEYSDAKTIIQLTDDGTPSNISAG
jgi:hypothetical protein